MVNMMDPKSQALAVHKRQQETQRKIDALRQQGRWIDVHGGDSPGANGYENNIRKNIK